MSSLENTQQALEEPMAEPIFCFELATHALGATFY